MTDVPGPQPSCLCQKESPEVAAAPGRWGGKRGRRLRASWACLLQLLALPWLPSKLLAPRPPLQPLTLRPGPSRDWRLLGVMETVSKHPQWASSLAERGYWQRSPPGSLLGVSSRSLPPNAKWDVWNGILICNSFVPGDAGGALVRQRGGLGGGTFGRSLPPPNSPKSTTKTSVLSKHIRLTLQMWHGEQPSGSPYPFF